MKRTIWLAIVYCLSVSLSSDSVFARGGGGGGGGGHVGGGGGGGAAGGHVGAVGHGGAGGVGGVHVGGGGGTPQFSGGAGSFQHMGGGQPSGGASNFVGHSGISASPQIGTHPNFSSSLQPGFNPGQSGGLGSVHNFGGVQQGVGGNRNIGGIQQGVGGNRNFSSPLQGGNRFGNQGQFSGVNHTGINHTGIAHQNFVGNSVNFGNRNINVGGAGYRPAYYRHGNYYHGYWNGNRGYGGSGYGLGYGYGGYGGYGYGLGLYGYRPYFWGLGGWGLGSLYYGSGYLGYSNPYYDSSFVGYNYSQPIPVVYSQPADNVDPNAVSSEHPSDTILNAAIASFRQNDYESALALANQGINQYPDDAVLHEFRALVLFAKGDYQPAAATVHAVLAVGPGWDWTTLSGIYADVGLYTAQLRTLETYVKMNQQDPASRFLLAYHYLSDGYPDAATRQLTQVVALVPSDQVAANLLKMTSSSQTTPSPDPSSQPLPQPPVDIPSPSQSNAAPVDPSTIIGNWKASRDDGSSFSLKLNNDKTFTWSFTPKQQPAQTFDGTYSLEGNVLALERTGGGSLVAEVTKNDGSKFNFKMVGAPNEDPGLNFTK